MTLEQDAKQAFHEREMERMETPTTNRHLEYVELTADGRLINEVPFKAKSYADGLKDGRKQGLEEAIDSIERSVKAIRALPVTSELQEVIRDGGADLLSDKAAEIRALSEEE